MEFHPLQTQAAAAAVVAQIIQRAAVRVVLEEAALFVSATWERQSVQ
jgi:hypothetical protein